MDSAVSYRGRRWWGRLLGEVRWSFRPPWTWLSGVAVNLVLSLLYLAYDPITGQPHRDWAILVGSYFAVFILADVTTTNVLGADSRRVRDGLSSGVSLRRILVSKNLALLLIVGLPTLIATAAITLGSEAGYRLVLTLPGVAFPILTWLGVGNVVSVLLPVAAIPLRQRWLRRREIRPTVRWLFHLGLPYLLLLAVDPVGELPRFLIHELPFVGHTAPGRGFLLCVAGLILYVLGTGLALALSRVRRVQFN